MTHIVTENCINCKYTSCVDVCPVDCFYEGENFLVINPDECIDCGVCVPECDADAIIQSNDNDFWTQLNADLSKIWPNIVVRKEPLTDADAWNGIPNKTNLLKR